jgi:hypothetical protein
MFEKTKKRVYEPVMQTARLAVLALLIAVIALIAAVTRAH